MDMLTQKDLTQIGALLVENNKVLKTEIVGEVVSQVVDQVVEKAGEMVEQNILPQFDALHSRIGAVETRLVRVETTMVTKDYLDDKLADLRGEFILRQRA